MWLKTESGILPPDGMMVNIRGYRGALKQGYRTQGHWASASSSHIDIVTAFELPDELAEKLIAAREADMNERIRAGRLEPSHPKVIRTETSGGANGRRSLDYWRLVLSMYDRDSGVYRLALKRITGYLNTKNGDEAKKTEPVGERGYIVIRTRG